MHLRPGVYSAVDESGCLRLVHLRHFESFGKVGAEHHAVLRRLAQGPCDPAELRCFAATVDDRIDFLSSFLGALQAGGWLMTTVYYGERTLYTVQPVRGRDAPPPPDAERRDLVLSAYAVLHREGDQMVVESPLATARIQVHDPAVTAFIGNLVKPSVTGKIPDSLPAEAALRTLRDLAWTGLAAPVPNSEDTDFSLRQWRPHELWFHSRTRMGNGGYFGSKYGRTQWAKGIFDSPPVRAHSFPGPFIDLDRPDLDQLSREDVTLSAAIESRRSVRVYDDDNPITASQLGQLLYRCARVRRTWVAEQFEYLSRPYPSGGGAHELEIYPVVRRASGLSPGMYYYDPHEHRLCLVREPGPEVARLLLMASRAAAMSVPPQVLIVIAARFGRLMWTYEEMPYSLILKHVGVLYQTMYLVATSMGLAACGLGGGDAMAFTEATGLEYTEESSVGEFMLGSRGA